jgi:hypothetical protein
LEEKEHKTPLVVKNGLDRIAPDIQDSIRGQAKIRAGFEELDTIHQPERTPSARKIDGDAR